MKRKSKNFLLTWIIFVFLCLIFLVWSESKIEKDKIVFARNEFGIAFLLKTKNHKRILFGAGKDSRIINFLGEHNSIFRKDLDGVFIIPEKKENTGGYLDVANRTKIDKIFARKKTYLKAAKYFLKKTKEKSIKVFFLDDYKHFIVDDIFLDVIFLSEKSSKKNQMLIKINKLGSDKVIMFAFLDKKTQTKIIESSINIKCDYLIYENEINKNFVKISEADKVFEIKEMAEKEISLGNTDKLKPAILDFF